MSGGTKTTSWPLWGFTLTLDGTLKQGCVAVSQTSNKVAVIDRKSAEIAVLNVAMRQRKFYLLSDNFTDFSFKLQPFLGLL